MRLCELFEVRRPIRQSTRVGLGVAGVATIVIAYFILATVRHQSDPLDKLTPTLGQMYQEAVYSLTPDEFSGERPFTKDIYSSLRLYTYGVGLAVIGSLAIGLVAGAWPWVNALVEPILKIGSYLPPISLIPVIFLFLGFQDTAKIFIIFIATFLPLSRSLIIRVQNIPEKQIWNGLILGPSRMEMILILIRRMIEPGFLDDLRLQLGTAWVYLIAAELIASEAGLGYRINVASRNLNVAMIFDYLLVVAVLAFLMDRSILLLNRWKNRWYYVGTDS